MEWSIGHDFLTLFGLFPKMNHVAARPQGWGRKSYADSDLRVRIMLLGQ